MSLDMGVDDQNVIRRDPQRAWDVSMADVKLNLPQIEKLP
jgi:hypothetical protein